MRFLARNFVSSVLQSPLGQTFTQNPPWSLTKTMFHALPQFRHKRLQKFQSSKSSFFPASEKRYGKHAIVQCVLAMKNDRMRILQNLFSFFWMWNDIQKRHVPDPIIQYKFLSEQLHCQSDSPGANKCCESHISRYYHAMKIFHNLSVFSKVWSPATSL